MTLTDGSRLGPYQIAGPLGHGGMGEVYRATDTRLGRTVAVKVLPEALAADPERRQRLEREARIAGSLSHPHICALYDIGEEGGTHFLVMEYLEGRTLAERLQTGRLPPDQALMFAIQMADALDKAHRRGIVHRDLKPANVIVTASGVKLLDFGLATRRAQVLRAGSEIPTADHQERLTREGAIVGTLQYMAPEQLEGREADSRTDIFAFGALVFEMFTGSKAFQSESQAGLIGAILRDAAPPIGELLPGVPPALAQSISRCLAKDPDERWQSAADLLFQLRSIAAQPAAAPASHNGATSREHRTVRRERALWTAAIAAATLTSIVATLVLTRGRSPETDSPVRPESATRFELFPTEGTSFYSGYDRPFALSPDGRHIVYVAVSGSGVKQLWLREWDSEAAQPMAGTEGAAMPFWSPDSQWIGFFAADGLKKMRASGGLPQTVATGVSSFAGAAWSTTDTILFPQSPTTGLSRVSAQGGPVLQATAESPEAGEGGHLWPRFLSDGNHFIYNSPNPSGIYVASLDSEAPRMLAALQGLVTTIEYVPGYVLYVSLDGGLFARAFDDERLGFVGEPVRIADGIPMSGPGRAPFSASATGALAYWPYAIGTPAALRWFDRNGRSTPAVDAPARYIGFALSPDARQLAFARVGADGRSDIWVRDLARGSESRLAFDGVSFSPAWSPDGARIAYSAARLRPPDVFVQDLGSASESTRVGATSQPDFPSGWGPDGRAIVSVDIGPDGGNDLWIWRLHDGQDPVGERLSLSTRFNETQGKVSPDGRWIAYVTDESGQDEVWVASFPSGENRRQISVAGGTAPAWGARSAEVFYISSDKQVMATPLTGGEVGTTQRLFRVDDLIDPEDRMVFPASNVYATTSDGQRFLMAVRAQDPDAPPISVVLNWHALLRR